MCGNAGCRVPNRAETGNGWIGVAYAQTVRGALVENRAVGAREFSWDGNVPPYVVYLVLSPSPDISRLVKYT